MRLFDNKLKNEEEDDVDKLTTNSLWRCWQTTDRLSTIFVEQRRRAQNIVVESQINTE